MSSGWQPPWSPRSPAPSLPIIRVAPKAWDPREDGAECDRCPLGPDSPFIDREMLPWAPVPPKQRPGALGLMVSDYPGETEVELLEPMVGPAGETFNEEMRHAGMNRAQFALDNCVSCRPGLAGDMDRLLYRVAKANRAKAREIAAEEKIPISKVPKERLWPTPAAACRPRLLRHMRQHQNLLLLGSVAVRSVLNDPEASITAHRGRPMLLAEAVGSFGATGRIVRSGVDGFPAGLPLGNRWRAIAGFNPAHVNRMRRFVGVFREDLARGLRHFTGALRWSPPTKVYRPGFAVLRAALRKPPKPFTGGAPPVTYPGFWALDIETGPDKVRVEWGEDEDKADSDAAVKRRLDFLRAKLRCIGVGDDEVVYVVPLLGRDGVSRYYAPDEEFMIRRELADFIQDPTRLKAGWNVTGYDWPVLEGGDVDALVGQLLEDDKPNSRIRRSGRALKPQGTRDFILDHHIVDAEMLHSLGEVASHRTDAPAWKTDDEGLDTAVHAKSDQDLWSRNADDVATTHVIGRQLVIETAGLRAERLLAVDHVKADMCSDLHRMGLRVDQKVRADLERDLEERVAIWTARCREISGLSKINPASPPQLVDLLYEKWNLEVFAFLEKTGEPSTDDACLIELYASPQLTDRQRAFIRALRKHRAAVKLLGSFIRPLRLMREGGNVGPDGRARPRWAAHTVVSGRLSVSGFALHGYPVWARKCFVPEDGHVFVMADKDQLELRIAASLAKAQFYLDMMRLKDGDPHSEVARRAWPCGPQCSSSGHVCFEKAPGTKKTGLKGKLRQLAKTGQYTALYGATIETIYKRLKSAEDEFGELVYADLTMPEVSAFYYGWLEVVPEFQGWWSREVEQWQRLGYVADVILGRRVGCQDDEEGDLSKISNTTCQATAAAAVDLETCQVLEKYPFEFAGPNTGLVIQHHDSLVQEVPENMAEQVRKDMTRMLTSEYPTLPGVVLTAEAEIARKWK